MWILAAAILWSVHGAVPLAGGALGANQDALSAPEVLQQVRLAHLGQQPHRVEYVRPANLGSSVPAEIAEVVSRVPGVSKVTFGGKELVVLTRETMVTDGADRYRIESESLQQGGIRDRRTSVSIWTRNTWTRAAGIGVPLCEHDEYPEVGLDEHIRLMAAGRTPHRRLLARCGYLPFVRYAIEMLAQAKDAETLLYPDGVMLVSEAIGIVIVANQRGEVVSGRMWDPATRETLVMRFVGRHAEPLMPALHPKESHQWMVAGNALKAHGFPADSEGGLVLYTSARSLPEAPDRLFSWRSVALSAKDHTGTIAHADGTEVPAQKPQPKAVNRPPTPLSHAAPPGRSAVVILTVTGIVLLAVGAVVWLKGRADGRG